MERSSIQLIFCLLVLPNAVFVVRMVTVSCYLVRINKVLQRGYLSLWLRRIFKTIVLLIQRIVRRAFCVLPKTVLITRI